MKRNNQIKLNKKIMKREEQNILKEPRPVYQIQIFHDNIINHFISFITFLNWHLTCKTTYHYIEENLFGKYTEKFVKDALKNNLHYLALKKHGTYLRNIVVLESAETIINCITAVFESIDSLIIEINRDKEKFSDYSTYGIEDILKLFIINNKKLQKRKGDLLNILIRYIVIKFKWYVTIRYNDIFIHDDHVKEIMKIKNIDITKIGFYISTVEKIDNYFRII
jgi:hypothetical protein